MIHNESSDARQARRARYADPNNNKLVKWQHRHTLVLYMHLAGQRTEAIATELGYHPARVNAIISSPLFKTRMAEELELLRDRTITGLLEMIRREAGPNFRFLVETRNDDTAEPRARLQAAKAIAAEVDRVFPRRIEHTEDRSVRITIDNEALRLMASAMAEVKRVDTAPIDATFTPVRDRSADKLPYAAIAADDFLKEIEQSAAAATAAEADEQS